MNKAPKIRTALVSVADKTNLIPLMRRLVEEQGCEAIYSTGNTYNALLAAGLPARPLTEINGPELLGGRVKTLGKTVSMGMLADPENTDHQKDMRDTSAVNFDFVYGGLYELEKILAKPGVTDAEINEETDIGGRNNLAATVKGAFNNARIVVSNPEDCALALDHLRDGTFTEEVGRELRSNAQAAVTQHSMASTIHLGLGKWFGMLGYLVLRCVYGENAWQDLAGLFSFFWNRDPLSLKFFRLVAGKAPSYNNYCDIDRMLQTITHIAAGFLRNFGKLPFIAIAVKHGNACGVGISWKSAAEALRKMINGDRKAIFGGSVMVNFELTEDLAEILLSYHLRRGEDRRFIDCITAPRFAPEAIEMLKRKKDKCRFLENPALANLTEDSLDKSLRFRFVRGGFLLQPNYSFVLDFKSGDWERSGRLTRGKMEDMILAWAIGCTSNSNTITLVKRGMLIGNGVGQQDRVGCCKLALDRAYGAGHLRKVKGAVAYSDSFFPFEDGPRVLAKAGIVAIFASRGSIRDAKIVKALRRLKVVFWTLPDGECRGFFGH